MTDSKLKDYEKKPEFKKPFVTVADLTKLPEKCPHLNTRNASQYTFEQPIGHYCNSVAQCQYLGRVDYQCPIIEYAREYEAIMAGKIIEGKYYEYVVTGRNHDIKMDNYSLLLKSSKRDLRKLAEKAAVVHSQEKIDEVQRLLEEV